MSDVSPDLLGMLEALLFSAGDPASVEDLVAASGADSGEVRAGLSRLREICSAPDRGVELVEVAGGWQLRTRATFSAGVVRLRGGRPAKLSPAALEVLAVVAYRQPVTRSEIESLRAVDCGGVLRTLLERDLVRVRGRRDEPGKPLEYGTTPVFLELFSLQALSSLPTLREREELVVDGDTESL